MDSPFESFVEKINRSADRIEIWHATTSLAQSIGFSGCSLVTASLGQHCIKNPQTLTTYGDDFRYAYENEGLGQIDPFLQFSCGEMSVKKVVSKDLSSFPDASAMHKLFLDHVLENGTKGGIGIPVRTVNEDVFGGWIMTSTESEDRIDLLQREHGRVMQLSSLFAYERMASLGSEERAQKYLLSPREQECLLWLCAGLRVAMIANKLSISESAVNLYITNAKMKLGATTREQAVARAISCGAIRI